MGSRSGKMQPRGHVELRAVEELASLRHEIEKARELERECRRTQEALEKERSFVSAILDTAAALVVVLDTKGRIVRFNQACEKATGYTYDEVKGKSLWDLFILPEEIESVRGVFENLKGGTFPSEFENHWMGRDGRRRLIAWSNTALPDDRGEVGYVIGTGIDITERRQAEEATSRLNNDLRSQAMRLESKNKELEAFSDTVSHDLRNPLLGVFGFCRMLQDRQSANLDEEGRKFLRIMQSSTQEMLRLVDELLAFSLSGNQQMTPSNFDMNELARGVFDELMGTAPDRKIQIHFATLPPAYGDKGMIRQVFLNLLSNAIKFTKPREIATIEIGGYVEGRHNTYYVRDNGIGFDNETSGKLFGAFHRLSNSADFAGTGLGLAIVQRIINRHGGKAWAEGRSDGGATFYFSLPRTFTCEG